MFLIGLFLAYTVLRSQSDLNFQQNLATETPLKHSQAAHPLHSTQNNSKHYTSLCRYQRKPFHDPTVPRFYD